MAGVIDPIRPPLTVPFKEPTLDALLSQAGGERLANAILWNATALGPAAPIPSAPAFMDGLPRIIALGIERGECTERDMPQQNAEVAKAQEDKSAK